MILKESLHTTLWALSKIHMSNILKPHCINGAFLYIHGSGTLSKTLTVPVLSLKKTMDSRTSVAGLTMPLT